MQYPRHALLDFLTKFSKHLNSLKLIHIAVVCCSSRHESFCTGGFRRVKVDVPKYKLLKLLLYLAFIKFIVSVFVLFLMFDYKPLRVSDEVRCMHAKKIFIQRIYPINIILAFNLIPSKNIGSISPSSIKFIVY